MTKRKATSKDCISGERIGIYSLLCENDLKIDVCTKDEFAAVGTVKAKNQHRACYY